MLEKLPHLIAVLPRLDQSILPLLGGQSLLKEDVTVYSNGISLNVTLISSAYHWILADKL